MTFFRFIRCFRCYYHGYVELRVLHCINKAVCLRPCGYIKRLTVHLIFVSETDHGILCQHFNYCGAENLAWRCCVRWLGAYGSDTYLNAVVMQHERNFGAECPAVYGRALSVSAGIFAHISFRKLKRPHSPAFNKNNADIKAYAKAE